MNLVGSVKMKAKRGRMHSAFISGSGSVKSSVMNRMWSTFLRCSMKDPSYVNGVHAARSTIALPAKGINGDLRVV